MQRRNMENKDIMESEAVRKKNKTYASIVQLDTEKNDKSKLIKALEGDVFKVSK
jgi:hypothetical protein